MKLWKTSTCDQKFKAWIRQRDGKCVRCGRTKYLEASHFFPVAFSSTRFTTLNVDTLCTPCHWGNYRDGFEYHKSCCYKQFKIQQIGLSVFQELEKKAHQVVPLEKARKEFQEWFENQ